MYEKCVWCGVNPSCFELFRIELSSGWVLTIFNLKVFNVAPMYSNVWYEVGNAVQDKYELFYKDPPTVHSTGKANQQFCLNQPQLLL